MLNSVCVFCGARIGNDPAYLDAAKELGTALGQANKRLVYGAGNVGIMGEIARATQSAGGKTFGVIPEHLEALEVGKKDLDTYVLTETMHERKKVMFMNADAFVTLPGGIGSLEEFFEALTWVQIDVHDKPMYLLNTNDYWRPLIKLIEHVINEGFAGAGIMDKIHIAHDVPDLMRMLK